MLSRPLSVSGFSGVVLLAVMSSCCAAGEPKFVLSPAPAAEASSPDTSPASSNEVEALPAKTAAQLTERAQQAEQISGERRKTSVRSPEQLRAAYTDMVRATSRRAEYDPLEVAPVALRLFIELAQAEDMSHAERTRMQSRLKVRLTQLRNRLIRDQKRQLRDAEPTEPAAVRRVAADSRESPETATPRAASLPGGGNGEAARAQELIELIENTIAPDTWDSRGGRGSIRYFSLLRVLVVRQTGEVHHQLGGTLDVLRD